MKKKELLKEVMGVPKVLNPWIKSFTKVIMNNLNKQDNWHDEGPVNYKNSEGEMIEDTALRMVDLEIPGKEVMEEMMTLNGFSNMKEFLSSEMFKNLPLWRPDIKYTIIGVPEELYNLESLGGRTQASIGAEANQQFSKLGKGRVYPNVVLKLETMVNKEDPLNNFEKEIQPTIAHELLHVFQQIKQLEKGKPSHFGKEMTLNSILQVPLVSDLQIHWWDYFLNLVYLHLSFEVNARVSQIYYQLKDRDIKTTEDFLKEVKKTSVWNQMTRLEDFDADSFIKAFKLPNSTDNPFEMMEDLFKKAELAKKGVNIKSEEEALKSLMGLWSDSLMIGNKGMKQLGLDITMDDLPESVKETPSKFFKFFEKRFHKKAKKWKKKLYRIASLLQQDREQALQKDKK